MTKQEQTYVQQIKNTLMEISTKGADTILMSECLKALNTLCATSIEEEQEE